MPAVRNFLTGKTGDDFFDADPDSELSSDLAALTEKIKALDKFITQDARFGKLTQLPKFLLLRQLVAMENLKEVLSARIVYYNTIK